MIDKEIREQLLKAEIELGSATIRIHGASRKVKAFRRSKFLNILGKQIGQMKVELAIFLGDYDTDIEEMEKTNFSLPSTKILKVIKGEKE